MFFFLQLIFNKNIRKTILSQKTSIGISLKKRIGIVDTQYERYTYYLFLFSRFATTMIRDIVIFNVVLHNTISV